MVQVKATGLFKYVWYFSGRHVLKGLTQRLGPDVLVHEYLQDKKVYKIINERLLFKKQVNCITRNAHKMTKHKSCSKAFLWTLGIIGLTHFWPIFPFHNH